MLAERGRHHEEAYLQHLRDRELTVLDDETGLTEEQRLQRIIDAMRAGFDVIPQADLMEGNSSCTA